MLRPGLMTISILLASSAVKIKELILCSRNGTNSENSRQGTVEISPANNFYYFCQEVDAI